MRSNQIDLQLRALFLADRNIGKRPESSGDPIDNLVGISHHIINNLATFDNLFPCSFAQVNLLFVFNDVINFLDG